MGINRARVWIGGLVGGVVWVVWTFVIGFAVVGMARYQAAQEAGQFLREPRYRFFEGQWIVMLILMGVMLAHLYAWARRTLGPGPKSALKIGLIVGFMTGFPNNFGTATWLPIDRMFPLGWMLELWVGAILATLVAGALYKE